MERPRGSGWLRRLVKREAGRGGVAFHRGDVNPQIPLLSPQILSLSGLEPFAKGGKRHCYVHPADDDLCIKVVADSDDERNHEQHRLELEDYAALKTRGSDSLFDRIPEIKGVVETDLGTGIVMRLYRDADGRISRTLSDVIREGGLAPPLIEAVDELRRWLRRQRLLTGDTGPHNVLGVSLGPDEWKLVIVEGWINRRYRRLARLHRRLTDWLIGRELRKFDRRTARLVESRRSRVP